MAGKYQTCPGSQQDRPTCAGAEDVSSRGSHASAADSGAGGAQCSVACLTKYIPSISINYISHQSPNHWNRSLFLSILLK